MVKEQCEQQIKIFLENIVYLRKHYGLSKKKMAKILQIGVGSLNKIERGELPERLGVDVILHMEDYFRIPAKDLFQKIGE